MTQSNPISSIQKNNPSIIAVQANDGGIFSFTRIQKIAKIATLFATRRLISDVQQGRALCQSVT